MDNKLVIPQDMRKEMKNSIHYGHPGRDAMLKAVEDVWWLENMPKFVQ